jgi:hypothetical protein
MNTLLIHEGPEKHKRDTKVANKELDVLLNLRKTMGFMEIEIKVVDDFKIQLEKIENECEMWKKNCTNLQRDLDATNALLSAHKAKNVEFDAMKYEKAQNEDVKLRLRMKTMFSRRISLGNLDTNTN